MLYIVAIPWFVWLYVEKIDKLNFLLKNIHPTHIMEATTQTAASRGRQKTYLGTVKLV